VFRYFNRFLISEWSRSLAGQRGSESVAASISACAFVLDIRERRLRVINSGFPIPLVAVASGRCEPCGREPGFPLGWFADNPLAAFERDIPPGGTIYIWTDGLEELAARLDVNPMTVAAELISARESGRTADCLKEANDDILLVQLKLNEPDEAVAMKMPVIYQELTAGQHDQIDELQTTWEKSLRLLQPNVAEDTLCDVLLCAREAVNNALRHGCPTAPLDRGTFEVCCDRARSVLRVVVSDPGPGHDFRWDKHVADAAENLIDRHRGLALIHQLPAQTRSERNGALLTMDFSLLKP